MALGTVIGGGLFLSGSCSSRVSTSNGVNVADGLDGLATGASILAIGSYIFIGFWQFNQSCFSARLDQRRGRLLHGREPARPRGRGGGDLRRR